MKVKLKTEEGRKRYGKRKQSVRLSSISRIPKRPIQQAAKGMREVGQSLPQTQSRKNYPMVRSELDVASVIDLLNGRWRSQVIHAGVELDVFEHLSEGTARDAADLAARTNTDPSLVYRLLRALSSIGLLSESNDRRFSATAGGLLLRADHPQTLRAMALLEEGPTHYAVWRHLPALIRSGKQDGFLLEFGTTLFDHLGRDAEYAAVFSSGLSSYSASEAAAIRQSMHGRWSDATLFCDVGGGYGVLLAEILKGRPRCSGIVLDLPQVTAEHGQQATTDEEVLARCTHVAGDMFVSVPQADVYILKHVLHDWNDAECERVLSVVRAAVRPGNTLLIYEWLVSRPGESDFAKLMDIHMLCVCNGRQRTQDEFSRLLASAGWRIDSVGQVVGSPLAVIEASPLI